MMLTFGSAFAHIDLVGEAETVDDAVTGTVKVEIVVVTGAAVRVLLMTMVDAESVIIDVTLIVVVEGLLER